ncbi:MAG: WYL domain-containing protein [Prevotellaceae bacterium]|nr:WYL domain-containing protein [Prevotellaceae bacterium]
MPTNKNAAIRYQALDKCFRDRRHRYYIDDLIGACEDALYYYNGVGGVSRRQIFEDIKFMESDTGWSIPLERKKDGKKVYYRYAYSDFSINKQPLTDEEAQQLQTVILTLSRFRGLPSNEWVEEVISNLEWRFNLKGRNENVIGFEQNPNLKGLEYLSEIIDATSNHQTLKIDYHNYKNGGKDILFVIHPYYVKQYNNRWFLFGLDDKRKEISNIALDRIVLIQVAPDVAFIPNETIDFEHFFDDIVGVSIPKEDIKKETIVLRFTDSRFPYVTSKPIHKSQIILSEDEHTISLEVKPTRELEQQILSFGSDVEILSPESFRTQIGEKIKDSFKKYFPVQNSCTNSV